jgi:hypothetical protein
MRSVIHHPAHQGSTGDARLTNRAETGGYAWIGCGRAKQGNS